MDRGARFCLGILSLKTKHSASASALAASRVVIRNCDVERVRANRANRLEAADAPSAS